MIYFVETLKQKHIASLNKNVLDCQLKDDKGNVYPKIVSIWEGYPNFEAITFGAKVEGEIVVNDKGYASLKLPKTGAAAGFVRKETSIAQAQDRKAQNIAEAQERTAEIWAKRSACELVAHHPAYKNLTEDEIVLKIQTLFNKISNLEVTEPFN